MYDVAFASFINQLNGELRRGTVTNPYAPTDRSPDDLAACQFRWSRRFAGLQLVTMAIALGFELWDVRSLAISGVVFFALSSVLVVIGFIESNRMSICVGFLGIVLSIAVALLMNQYGWATHDDDTRIRSLIWVYSVLTGPVYCATFVNDGKQKRKPRGI